MKTLSSKHQTIFWFAGGCFLQYVHRVKRERELDLWCLIRVVSHHAHSTQTTSSQPDYHQQALPPNIITLRGEVSTCEFGGERNTLSIAPSLGNSKFPLYILRLCCQMHIKFFKTFYLIFFFYQSIMACFIPNILPYFALNFILCKNSIVTQPFYQYFLSTSFPSF